MKIIVAEKAGYCFGITNAMKLAEDTLKQKENQPIYCLGDLSHNRQEMKRLEERGIIKVDRIDDIPRGTVIIRSHGVSKEVIDQAKAKHLKIVNATCPFVGAMQHKVYDYDRKGYQIVIVGDADHPEVQGAVGWCDERAIVINTPEEAEALPHYEKMCVVAQTTAIEKKFNAITSILQEKADECMIFNTICSATAERQSAAVETAKRVEYMIVVGGYHSSNTRKLFEVCKAHCSNTCHIETAGELNLAEVKKYNVIGITAGASTPDWIVKEVTERMEENKTENTQVQDQAVEETVDENDFAAMLDQSLQDKPIHRGSTVEGEVIEVTDDEIILNIKYKADGVIKKSDYSWKDDIDLKEEVKKGDMINAVVTNMNDDNGAVRLSKIKYDNQKIQRQLEEAYKDETILDGKIKSVSGSGLIVDIGFTDIFMPASQYSVRYIKDLNTLVGKDVRGKIIDYNARRRRAIFSQRVILEKEMKERQKEQRARKEERFNEIQQDDVVTGKVKTITNFGIFIDLDGIDGFVHRSDLTWSRANEPKNLVEKGQEIEAKVIQKNDEEKKIKLSVKALQPKPWDAFVEQYKEGDIVDVKITNVLDFGAFAEIIPGVEGLIHISEISYRRVESVASELNPGDVVKVKIIGINREKEKISLSIKATQKAPERAQKRHRKSGEGFQGRQGGRKPRKRQPQHNTTVYEDNANFTLGDSFGDLLGKLDFGNAETEETTDSEE
ncbi:bifunctional 4-hydroxy-3-methylbut-2-enyl diphosphate reductase/30S ribosomal protein S1 [Pseudoramibacter porci]|uniref:4-hydroxy-3-methylbut-2-enyl diphosphate reductase n=1 Tax=Pseudoramibacter porci TaxID=2606631 RepID=A0A7X2NFB0_9FIRM|nr:bifunctional 4-hydroxy-3-methylbut-2-enyl diphosphate reductase/30S ribosomal protein S1 [Pseudoramibacter porci]MSS19048.1 bifunctional 4-hydroxy-3-methylbut-2-enyl diphosphate reductase/30S ribosomal protein S1 [Pseudoramibacter porci]